MKYITNHIKINTETAIMLDDGGMTGNEKMELWQGSTENGVVELWVETNGDPIHLGSFDHEDYFPADHGTDDAEWMGDSRWLIEYMSTQGWINPSDYKMKRTIYLCSNKECLTNYFDDNKTIAELYISDLPTLEKRLTTAFADIDLLIIHSPIFRDWRGGKHVQFYECGVYDLWTCHKMLPDEVDVKMTDIIDTQAQCIIDIVMKQESY